jgi:hypothetical protein
MGMWMGIHFQLFYQLLTVKSVYKEVVKTAIL